MGLRQIKREFDHIGMFTDTPQPQEFWVPASELWVTNPRTHPMCIEYLRPKVKPRIDPANVGLWKLWNLPHVAYSVENLEEAVRDEEVIYGPIEPADFGRVVFIHKDGAVIEYMQYTQRETWFGQPTPWRPAGPE